MMIRLLKRRGAGLRLDEKGPRHRSLTRAVAATDNDIKTNRNIGGSNTFCDQKGRVLNENAQHTMIGILVPSCLTKHKQIIHFEESRLLPPWRNVFQDCTSTHNALHF